EALRDVVRRMLSRSPDDRPQSYEEILDVLDRLQRGLPPALEPDPLALRTLPPPVEGRMGSSTPSSPSPSPPVARSTPATAEAERPASVEASQQKRWPDLDPPSPPTERFAPLPSPPSPAIPASPSPSPATVTHETLSGVTPATMEQVSPPASPDATKTAPTVVSEISMWAGGTAVDSQPEPVSSSSDLIEEKTERLDDVIAKLRQQSSREPLPPLEQSSAPGSLSSAPPSQPVRRPESAAASNRASERTRVAPPKPGQRLVVYGEPPPEVMAPPRAVPRAVAPAASAPAPDATSRRIRGIGIGLIVAAIVVLFAAVLWVLISLLRGASAGETRRSSHAVPTGVVAAAALKSVDPKPE
ncbi:MAG: hypothetical protein ACXWFS_01550, partial [Thermoanaerobaculia bacterium]